MIIFYILLSFAYIFLNLNFSKKVIQYNGFSKGQKIINVILVWILPFIWYYLIKDIIKEAPLNTIENRKVSTYQYHETGYPRDY